MNSSGYPARRRTRQNSSWDRDAGPDVIRQAYARHARARASPHLLIPASRNDLAGLPQTPGVASSLKPGPSRSRKGRRLSHKPFPEPGASINPWDNTCRLGRNARSIGTRAGNRRFLDRLLPPSPAQGLCDVFTRQPPSNAGAQEPAAEALAPVWTVRGAMPRLSPRHRAFHRAGLAGHLRGGDGRKISMCRRSARKGFPSETPPARAR
jgi:hypothetical protein